MVGIGTSVYSVLFVGAALIVAVLIGKYLIEVWQTYAKKFEEAEKKDWPKPSAVTPLIKTVVIVVVYVTALTLGWNLKQSVTTHSSRYTNPSETAEKKKLQEFQPPSIEEMDSIRAEQKQRSETKPHKDALDSFDESMEKEAKKIRERSLDESSTNNSN